MIKRMNKKGVEIALNTIVIAIIALVVMIIVILVFTGVLSRSNPANLIECGSGLVQNGVCQPKSDLGTQYSFCYKDAQCSQKSNKANPYCCIKKQTSG